jgi:O-glycosyl hydrolase
MNHRCVRISRKSLFICFLSIAFFSFSGYASKDQKSDGVSVSLASVRIDPAVTYQVMEGWGEGGMDTFIPAWYVLYRPSIHELILDSLYTLKDNGLGLNICRFLAPMGDNPEHDHMSYMTPLANKPFELEDGVFVWDGHEDILWRAKGAQNRGATVWASFYSPPYWLTTSGCTIPI